MKLHYLVSRFTTVFPKINGKKYFFTSTIGTILALHTAHFNECCRKHKISLNENVFLRKVTSANRKGGGEEKQEPDLRRSIVLISRTLFR